MSSSKERKKKKNIDRESFNFRNNYIKNIKFYMDVKHIRIVDIVEDGDVSQATVSQTLNNYWVSTNVNTLRKICVGLHIDFVDIFMDHCKFIKKYGGY